MMKIDFYLKMQQSMKLSYERSSVTMKENKQL